MYRAPDLIQMPLIKKSQYEVIRDENIKECREEFLRIFGYPMDAEYEE